MSFRPTLPIAGLFVALALLLRVLFPSHIDIEHFDEGVYASNLWFSAETGFAYPGRHFYAPPLVPSLIETAMIVFGTSGFSAMLPSLLCGSLTVGGVWLLSRAWFGGRAAAAAGILAATSGIHVAYSRMALTDVVLGFWWVLALLLLQRCLAATDRTRDLLRPLVVAGVICGLAWWTKYNGWLLPALATASAVGVGLVRRRQDACLAALLSRCVLIGLVALAVWAPFWWSLQTIGGYSVVARNHAGYIRGWSHWWSSAGTLLENIRAFDGPVAVSGLAAALSIGLVSVADLRFTWNRRAVFRVALAAIGLSLVSLMALRTGVAVVCGAATIVALGLRARRDWMTSRGCAASWWLLAVWFGALMLATPLYTPYPRLSLPWVMSGWIGAAALIGARAEQRPTEALATGWSARELAALGLILTPVVLALWLMPSNRVFPRTSPWQNHASLREAVEAMVVEYELAGVAGQPTTVVYTYAEPAVFFHLSRLGVPAVPLGSPSAVPPGDALLIWGPQAERLPDFPAQWEALAQNFVRLGTWEFLPSDILRMNWALPGVPTDAPRVERLQVFRPR